MCRVYVRRVTVVRVDQVRVGRLLFVAIVGCVAM